jgi:hypothetical protein
VPLSLRDVKLEKSSVAWSDIGGLVETRQVLRETLEWPTKYAAIFAGCPLRLRSGLLLYGYPGCGKTLLASAVAKECGLNFIAVKGPEILNKYIGASEKSVSCSGRLCVRARHSCTACRSAICSTAPRRRSLACCSLTSSTRSPRSGASLGGDGSALADPCPNQWTRQHRRD